MIQGQGQTEGQLQIIPQGVTVIPSPGQQLMQAAMPNGQVQRFLFTPMPPSSSAAIVTPASTTSMKPTVCQSTPSQGQTQVQTASSVLAETQMAAPVPVPTCVPGPVQTLNSPLAQVQTQISTPVPALPTEALTQSLPSTLPTMSQNVVTPVHPRAQTTGQKQISTLVPDVVHTQALSAAAVLPSIPTQSVSTCAISSASVPAQIHVDASTPNITHVSAPNPASVSSPIYSAPNPLSASLPVPVQVPTGALAPISAPVAAVVSTHIDVPSQVGALNQIQATAPVHHSTVAGAVVTPVTATATTPSVPGKELPFFFTIHDALSFAISNSYFSQVSDTYLVCFTSEILDFVFSEVHTKCFCTVVKVKKNKLGSVACKWCQRLFNTASY